MNLDKHAVERAHYILDTHRESKRLYDAGDKKKVHWRILEKELPMAEEIIRLNDVEPPKPKIEDQEVVTETNWWHVILAFILGSLVVWGLYQV